MAAKALNGRLHVEPALKKLVLITCAALPAVVTSVRASRRAAGTEVMARHNCGAAKATDIPIDRESDHQPRLAAITPVLPATPLPRHTPQRAAVLENVALSSVHECALPRI